MSEAEIELVIPGPDGTLVPSAIDGDAENVPAWQLVEAGRYMPRRIRGSCRGRELG